MPNLGKFWTKDEVNDLREAYKDKPPHVSKIDFARKYSKISKYTINAIRAMVNRFEP